MSEANTITVEVAYALPEKQAIVAIRVPAGRVACGGEGGGWLAWG